MTLGGRKSVIVTGLDGLIGSELATAAPLQLIVLPLGEARPVDITDALAVESALNAHPDAEVLVHLAAFTDTNQAHAERGRRDGLCYRVNVEGTRHIARACARRGIHLIHASTDFVFSGDRDTPYAETDPPAPIDWYGQTKRLGEEEAAQAPAWTIVRLAFPYGQFRHPRDLLGKILGGLERGETLRLFDDQHVTPTFVGDIAAGLLRLAQAPPKNEILHLTGPECVTPYAFGLAVAEAFDLPQVQVQRSRLAELAVEGGRPRHRALCMDNSRWAALAESVGMAPPLGIREGLKAARRRRDAPGPEWNRIEW